MKPSPQSIVLNAGVNLNRDPSALRQEHLALTKNAWPVKPGILGKRNGCVVSRIGIAGGTTEYFVRSFAIAPAQCGYRFVYHAQAIPAAGDPYHFLCAGDLDRDTGLASGITIQLPGFDSDPEPVKFVQYRGLCFAIVPGLEGHYTLAPKKGGGYEWVKSTFTWDPAVAINQASQATPVMPRTACQYKQRMVWANFGPGMGNWIIFSDKAGTQVFVGYTANVFNRVGVDVLSLNGRHVEVGSIEGEDIVAAQEVTMTNTGTALTSLLMLLTNNSCTLISGEILQTGDSGATDPSGLFGSYEEHRVNYNCGCVSADTLVKTPYGWMWAAGDDVWILENNTPIRVATNIRPAMLACPVIHRKRWSAAYVNGLYVLSLVTGSAAANDTSTFIHQYWILDMRDGPPQGPDSAEWYGPLEVVADDGSTNIFSHLLGITQQDGAQDVACCVTNNDVDFANTGNQVSLLSMFGVNESRDNFEGNITSAPRWAASAEHLIGDVIQPTMGDAGAGLTGRFYVFTALAGGAVAPYTSGATEPVWPNTTGGSVVDGEIVWTEILSPDAIAAGSFLVNRKTGEYQAVIRTRDDALGEHTHEKLLRRVDTSIIPSAKLDVTVSAIVNRNSSKSVGTATFGPSSIELGVDTIPATIGEPKAYGRTFRPAETSLVQGRQVQLKIQDENKYIIDDSNDYFNICWFLSSGGSPPTSIDPTGFAYNGLQVQLTHGAYDSIADVYTELVAKLNAAASILNNIGSFAPNPWGYDNAYLLPYPYLNRLKLTWASISVYCLGPVFSSTDIASTSVAGISGVGGTSASSLYLSRAKRLAGMLGFDTSMATTSDNPNVNVSAFAKPSDFTFFQGLVTAVPKTINLDATIVVPKVNSQRFDIIEATMVLQPKPAVPMTSVDRS